jgi:predicted acyl esterase
LERLNDEIPVRFIGTNGDHGEYYGDAILPDIERFLSYYLKEEVPEEDSGSYEDALEAYESEDPVRIYWEMDHDRNPRFSTTYGTWPPEEVETWRLYLHPDGSLQPAKPDASDASSDYEYSPQGPLQQLVPRNDDDQLQWETQRDGTYVAFVSEALEEDHVLLGSGSVELWVKSDEDDTDIEVTLSEIRPDETEMYVQNGWLRASHRAENAFLSRPRRPWHSHRAADTQTLPEGEFVRLRIELFPFGHVFRAGSKVKLAAETPGGNRPLWGFQLLEGKTTNTVAHSSEMPSSVALPLVPDESAEADIPECGTVSNQPCRPVE